MLDFYWIVNANSILDQISASDEDEAKEIFKYKYSIEAQTIRGPFFSTNDIKKFKQESLK